MDQDATPLDVTAIAVDSTDGVTVVAHDYGGPTAGPANPTSPPRTILFSHATGFHGRYWDRIAPPLTRQFRVVSIDLRGHGDCVVPPGTDLAWSGMAQDLLAVIDALDLHHVDAASGMSTLSCVGHSMGACALLLAELERPGLFRSGWMMEPIVFPVNFASGSMEENALVVGARKRREVFESRDAVFERYTSRPPFSLCDSASVRAYVDYGFRDLPDGSVRLKCRGNDEADVFANSLTDAWDRVDQITMPLVVAGSSDGGHAAEVAPRIAERIDSASFELLDGLTHIAPLQDPELTIERIRAALG